MPAYDFPGTAAAKPPTLARPQQFQQLAQLGLDMVTPIDLMKSGRTPYAKNFRLYAQQSDDRQVAVSSRKGPGFYVSPLSETESVVVTSTTGASTANIGQTLNVVMQRFQAANDNRLTKLDLNLANPNGARGAVRIEIWSDNSGVPARLLSESSISGGDIGETASYKSARFINPVQLVDDDYYWIILRVQDDGSGEYEITTTTSEETASVTNASFTAAVAQEWAINFKTYTTANSAVKGVYRFERDNGDNITLVAIGTNMYKVDESSQTFVSIASGLSASAKEYSFANGDNKVFWVNGYDNLKAWNGTSVETITDAQLPVLSQIAFHKDRLWGVVASDPNKLVFSENPGNPAYESDGTTPTDPSEQWYYAWLSVSFIYVPRPHNGSPVTALESFQDSLIVFTQDGKYIISGYDRGSFILRESTGFKGALSRRGVTKDENNIYFAAHDGLYSFNGSADTKISNAIEPLFDGCPNKDEITPVVWKNKVRFYMASAGSLVNDICVLLNNDLDEWEYDTDTFVDRAVYYDDADDDNQLVELSSLTPMAMLAEQDYNSLGAPIDFEYRFNYNSLGTPAQKKRIKKFFPITQGVDSTFPLTIAIDKDFQNSPRYKQVLLTVNGTVFGTEHELGDGVLFGGQTSFKMNKLRFSGYGYYWQMRVMRKAVNNRVAFVGAQFSYKTKRI